eukprot:131902_1
MAEFGTRLTEAWCKPNPLCTCCLIFAMICLISLLSQNYMIATADIDPIKLNHINVDGSDCDDDASRLEWNVPTTLDASAQRYRLEGIEDDPVGFCVHSRTRNFAYYVSVRQGFEQCLLLQDHFPSILQFRSSISTYPSFVKNDEFDVMDVHVMCGELCADPHAMDHNLIMAPNSKDNTIRSGHVLPMPLVYLKKLSLVTVLVKVDSRAHRNGATPYAMVTHVSTPTSDDDKTYCYPVKTQEAPFSENTFISIPPQNAQFWTSVGVFKAKTNHTETNGMYMTYYSANSNSQANVAIVDMFNPISSLTKLVTDQPSVSDTGLVVHVTVKSINSPKMKPVKTTVNLSQHVFLKIPKGTLKGELSIHMLLKSGRAIIFVLPTWIVCHLPADQGQQVVAHLDLVGGKVETEAIPADSECFVHFQLKEQLMLPEHGRMYMNSSSSVKPSLLSVAIVLVTVIFAWF